MSKNEVDDMVCNSSECNKDVFSQEVESIQLVKCNVLLGIFCSVKCLTDWLSEDVSY